MILFLLFTALARADTYIPQNPMDAAAETRAALERIDASLSGLAAFLKEAPRPPARVEPADVRTYCRQSPLTVEEFPKQERVLLFGCRAFEREDPKFCLTLPGGLDDHSDCRAHYWDARLAKLIARGDASAAGFCLKMAEERQWTVSAEALSAGCKAAAEGRDLSKACRDFAATYRKDFPTVDFCLTSLGIWTGQGCGGWKPFDYQQLSCPDFGVYARAAKAGSLQECGGSYLCRAMMGEKGACERPWQAFLDKRCGTGETPPLEPFLAQLADSIEDTRGWELGKSVRDAAARLHRRLRGEEPLEPSEARKEALLLRRAHLDALFSQARAALELLPKGPARARLQKTLDSLAARRKSVEKPS
jgi:hypothetical protein